MSTMAGSPLKRRSSSASGSVISWSTERCSVSGMRMATSSCSSVVELFLSTSSVPASTDAGRFSKR